MKQVDPMVALIVLGAVIWLGMCAVVIWGGSC